jgi:hypothetical protein
VESFPHNPDLACRVSGMSRLIASWRSVYSPQTPPSHRSRKSANAHLAYWLSDGRSQNRVKNRLWAKSFKILNGSSFPRICLPWVYSKAMPQLRYSGIDYLKVWNSRMIIPQKMLSESAAKMVYHLNDFQKVPLKKLLR